MDVLAPSLNRKSIDSLILSCPFFLLSQWVNCGILCSFHCNKLSRHHIPSTYYDDNVWTPRTSLTEHSPFFFQPSLIQDIYNICDHTKRSGDWRKVGGNQYECVGSTCWGIWPHSLLQDQLLSIKSHLICISIMKRTNIAQWCPVQDEKW